MSEKFPRSDLLDASKASLQNKLKTAVGLGAVAVATLAGEGCSPKEERQSGPQNKDQIKGSVFVSPDADFSEAEIQEALKSGARDKSESHNSLRKEREVTKGMNSEQILSHYYANIQTGHVSVVESKERAKELVAKKGIRSGEIKFKTIGGVPVEISIGGQPVPVGPDDYTSEELKRARAGQSASDWMK